MIRWRRLPTRLLAMLLILLPLPVLPGHTGALAAGRWTSDPLSSTTQKPAVAVVGAKLLFAGGYTFPSSGGYATDVVDLFDSATGRWSSGRLSVPRAGLKTATIGMKAFFFGGVGGRGGSYEPGKGAVDVYDDATETWTSTRLPGAGSEQWTDVSGGATVGTKLIVVGTSHSAIYDDATGRWSAVPKSEERYGSLVATVGTQVLIAGGRGEDGPSAAVDIYDAVTGAWSTARLAEPHEKLVATTVDGKLVIVGETLDASRETASIDVYDAATGQWSSASVPGALRNPVLATVDETAFLVGDSRSAPVEADGRLHIYEARTGQWTTSTVPAARTSPLLATVGTKVLILGGRTVLDGQRRVLVDADRVDIYDVESGAWSVAQLSEARSGLGVARIGDRLILAGGYRTGTPGGSAAVDVYDDATGQWSTATLSYGRGSPVAVSVGSIAVFAAGETIGGPIGTTALPTSRADVYDDAAE